MRVIRRGVLAVAVLALTPGARLQCRPLGGAYAFVLAHPSGECRRAQSCTAVRGHVADCMHACIGTCARGTDCAAAPPLQRPPPSNMHAWDPAGSGPGRHFIGAGDSRCCRSGGGSCRHQGRVPVRPHHGNGRGRSAQAAGHRHHPDGCMRRGGGAVLATEAATDAVPVCVEAQHRCREVRCCLHNGRVPKGSWGHGRWGWLHCCAEPVAASLQDCGVQAIITAARMQLFGLSLPADGTGALYPRSRAGRHALQQWG